MCSASPSLPRSCTSRVGGRWNRRLGGAANLSGLTPPALPAPHPLPPIQPPLGFSVAAEGCKAGWNSSVRAGILVLGRTCAFACMHTRTRTHAVGTLWVHCRPCTCSLAQPGLQGKLELGGARPCVRAFAHECCPVARTRTHIMRQTPPHSLACKG